jgi:hypothetical protein
MKDINPYAWASDFAKSWQMQSMGKGWAKAGQTALFPNSIPQETKYSLRIFI